MPLTEEQRRELIRATDRARHYLRAGDHITFTSCPGTKRWGIFTGFDGECICTKTRDDVSARSITKVNGIAVDFTDAGVCDMCAHDGMGSFNGLHLHRRDSPCNGLGCPYLPRHLADIEGPF
ncbi:hypothetical protein FJU08_01215 [Martelella alba]|uniref:Uncharacterized protein n=1 Tax=Martelella alba TaxID=2590451 RepID=A0A506UIP8_9HYPH|nr:hypothetical protein [Martelella alba]TPW33214.1 hypothetical protein FJU08_01215 [Martelella alba]